MYKVAQWNYAQRVELFQETSSRMGVVPAVIEKDFWVCIVLDLLFKSSLKADIVFKGGTSLSKVYGLINRFSEDIDLILNWELLGYCSTGENPWDDRTKTKQDLFNKSVNSKAVSYISNDILPLLRDLFTQENLDLTALIDQNDPFSICISYPNSFPTGYVKPEIRLEIGPLAEWLPQNRHRITPYAAEQFSALFTISHAEVNAIEARRTFWEKATILHQEAHRPESKPVPLRYSRHYYDLYRMIKSPVAEEALADLELLNRVVLFKQKFYPCGWANYEMAVPGSLKLVPSSQMIAALRKDFSDMRVMLFGIIPSFEEIIGVLADFELKVNLAKA